MTCLLLPLLAAVTTSAAAETQVLRGVSIVDVERGIAKPGQRIVIREGIIEWIGRDTESELPEGAEVLDYAGKFVMPGLWDMHVHPEQSEDLELMVLNGVLGARSLMGEPRHLQWRAEIALGQRTGPLLFLAGPIVEGVPPKGMEGLIATKGRRLIATEQEGIREARAQHEAGFDYIKVYNNLPITAYKGLIEEGRRLDIPVLGHVPIEVGLEKALASGQIGIEHLRGSIQLLVRDDAPVQPGNDLRSRMLAWQYVDETRMNRLVQLTARSGAYHCPTVVARLFFSPGPQVEEHLRRPQSIFIRPRWRGILENRKATKWLSNFSERDFEAAAEGFEAMDTYILALHEAGVPLLAGTDMGPWGFTLHDELAGLVEAGLTAAEALRTATVNAAMFSDVEGSMGVIKEGARADLLVLDANPLKDISNTRAIRAVLQQGRIMGRSYLDERLAQLASP